MQRGRTFGSCLVVSTAKSSNLITHLIVSSMTYTLELQNIGVRRVFVQAQTISVYRTLIGPASRRLEIPMLLEFNLALVTTPLTR